MGTRWTEGLWHVHIWIYTSWDDKLSCGGSWEDFKNSYSTFEPLLWPRPYSWYMMVFAYWIDNMNPGGCLGQFLRNMPVNCIYLCVELSLGSPLDHLNLHDMHEPGGSWKEDSWRNLLFISLYLKLFCVPAKAGEKDF